MIHLIYIINIKSINYFYLIKILNNINNMGILNIIDNIGLYIIKFINFVFTTNADSYAPINLTNVKYLAFILGVFLFFIENFIILFFRGISDVFNKYSPTEIPHFNITSLIDVRIVMALSVILSFINIFFTKNIIKRF